MSNSACKAVLWRVHTLCEGLREQEDRTSRVEPPSPSADAG